MGKNESKNATGTAMQHWRGLSMPTYDFYCSYCDDQWEIWLSIEASNQTMVCHCGSPLKKLFSAIPTHFKGEGWASKN
jgi:putative FmdB family regulatory protein